MGPAHTIATPPRLRFSLAPEPSRLLRARERIRDYLTQQCADATTVNDVVLAVEEACTNAIRHSGSRADIEVLLAARIDGIEATVKDRGRGFDVATFDPALVPDLLLDHGRGLFLMSRLCDELELRRDDGLEVRLVKRVAGAPTVAAEARFGHALLGGGEGLARADRRRAMLDEIDEGFEALDWEYRYVYVNAAALQRLGMTLEDLLGHTPWELFPALEGSELEESYREAMELGRPSVIEHRSVVDGQWLEARIYPTTAGISCYYRGVDERKRRERERDELLEALRENRTMLERSQELAHLGSWELDLASGRLTWSDEVYRIFGLAPQQFGATYAAFLEQVHPDDRAAVDAAYSGSLRENHDSYEIEHRVVRRHTGEVRIVHERCRHLRDGTGKVVRSIGMVHDITESKQTEAALRDGEARLRLASRAGAVGLYEWNATSDTAYWGSPQAYELFGLGPDGPVTFERWLACVHPDDRERLARRMAELRRTGVTNELPRVDRDEYRVLRRDGQVLWLEAVNTLDREGADIVVRGAVRDITDRKLAEQALERSRRRAELLAWTASSLLSTDDPWGLVEELCRRVMTELDCQVFFNYVLDGDSGRLRLNAWTGVAEEEARRIAWLDRGEAVCGRAARDACPVVAEEIPASSDPHAELVAPFGLAAYACHPLMVQDEVLGTLSFGTSTRRRFDDDDLALMQAVADHVAMAVHHWRAENERRSYELLAANSRDVMLFMDRTGRILHANPAAEQTYGYSREELTGLTIADLRAPETRGELQAQMAEADERGILFETAHRRRDGSVFPVEVSARGATIGGRRTLLSTVRDVSERKRHEEDLVVLRQVGEAAASSLRVVEVAERLIEAVRRLLDTSAAIVALETAGRLLPLASYGYPPGFVEHEITPLPEESLGAEAFRSRTPRLIRDAAASTPGLSAWSSEVSLQLGFGSLAALPMLVEGRPLGVAVFVWSRPRCFDPAEVSFLESVVTTASVGLRNARLYEEEREAARLGHALARIDTVLHAAPTSAEAMHAALSEGAQTLDAQTAFIASHQARGFRIDHTYGGLSESVGRLIPGELDAHGLLALGGHETVAIDEARHDRSGHWFMGKLAVESLLVAPLTLGRADLGCLYFAYTAAPHHFSQAEVDFATKLAASLSLALRNVADYEEQRDIALVLQESFLHELPVVPGLEIGRVAQPAFAPGLVGGDFSDVFLLDDGRVAVLIGDVAGKGIEAAGLTETVHSTVRALAAVDPSPAFVLGKTNELLLRRGPDDHYVTAFYCLLDPRTGHLACASAGHPAAIHLGPHLCRPLAVRFGAPLGTFEGRYESDHTTLTLEDYLVLYTDGVTEARRGRDLYGQTRIVETVAGLRGRSAQDLAESLVGHVSAYAGRLTDDIEVVALRLA